MNNFSRPDPTNDAQIAAAKKEFEAKYGIDKNSRTPEQWKSLVETYGKNIICQTDGLTPKQLRAKMKFGNGQK